ncbi:hypothetical protein G3567_00025 [Psychroflexus sp. YR1-1]|uniref:Uncharacterized protein n=1 Tax=Psychroflexus aurantiacus TaxID=2709310 RepID=A0A6B3QWU2_9FLAO|nr:hypothetical protein [Psychroflexus aurantiacus]NEV92536.1 hypothetical protein [Psychroflexus aurantiacus]
MKKIKLLILLSILTHGTLYSQWETKYHVNDFGDQTCKTYETFVVTGTFTNSANTNRDAAFAFIKDGKSLIIKVYEYGSNLATSLDHSFEEVKIKLPGGKILKLDSVPFTKQGSLCFKDQNFTEAISALSNSGPYTIVFDRTTDYSTSSYKVKFDL